MNKGITDAKILKAKLSELEKMRKRIDIMVADIQSRLGVQGDALDMMCFSGQDQNHIMVETKSRTPKRRAVREHVLDCLEDLDWIAYTREIAQYSAARYGREITSARFGPLVKDEAISYRGAGSRSVWLCCGLTHDRFEPIKRLLGRSDWPIERRIIGPTSGRIQHIAMTARLCELAIEAEENAADPLMLKILAADHARDLPGIKLKRGQFDLKSWCDIAKNLLKELLPRDEELRMDAAVRLRKLSPLQQLFGMPEVLDLEPGCKEEVLRR